MTVDELLCSQSVLPVRQRQERELRAARSPTKAMFMVLMCTTEKPRALIQPSAYRCPICIIRDVT